MDKHPLYGKKKKKKEVCPNPLFVQWLTEWRDSAAEKGIKSQYTYGKALNTLRKFPLRFETGKECKILENFGDKICKMLDEKLAEHVSLYGTTAPVDVTDTVTDVHLNNQARCKVTTSTGAKKENVKAAPKENIAPVRVHDISDNSDDEVQEQPARKRQRSGRHSGEREYIPAFRSGPYALLLTLYRDMQSAESQGFLSKADLVRKAQPLADKSFTMADPGCRYTAWSSMGTLIKKGLIIKESSPARYSITDAGCELAHKLEAVQEGTGTAVDTGIPFRIHDPVPDTAPRLPNMPQDYDRIEYNNVPENAPIQASSRLKYWYVTEEGTEVLVKDKAVVSIDDEIGVGFLVKCNYTELLKSGVKYKLDTTRPLGDNFVYVYLGNENTDDIANAPFGNVNTHIVQGRTHNAVHNTEHEDVNLNMNTGKRKIEKPRKTTAVLKAKETPQLLPLIKLSLESKPNKDDGASKNIDNIVVIDSEESSRDYLPSIQVPKKTSKHKQSKDTDLNSIVPKSSSVSDRSDSQSLFERLSSKQDIPKSLLLDSQDSVSQCTVSNLSSSQGSIKSVSSVSSGSSTQTLPVPDFVLRPGEFEIVLCIDNAEFYGANKGSSKTLLPDLIKNGIDCDLRKLHVGDLLWIAKEKSRPVQGQLTRPPGRELVLNYIIERKRMDDLVGSCIDGRFKEQKFRLKKCGLHHMMYLVEDYGSIQHFSLPESTIKQAITNTQVIDGFQVKRTKDTKETVAFLTVFTRYLQSHFKDKTLYACSLDDIKESKIVTNVNDSHQKLATFEEFNQGSVKSKALTVQEMFGKQLIQLHGMSAEKARAVLDKYPTPSHLFQAYEICSTDKEKENLLTSVKCGKSSRSLGQAQSKQMYQLYNTCTPLS
ncbi:crossover junction endonuclease MUS81-like [Mercenaria mercenaria]|uniref:crossover junction endonuclease MUS81-like n=1 Tax=Mercenaria mercenaria TaxID=6596 RepID=UPI00234F7D42|nr:crossover junction endonuclease MUS81-like [Mercenaria mercenaria]XP_053377303.1 crossover junction endonuclease MUS81-like [Mercenaria mercenaria]XP_053377310.1 crossover junction endonuclease MUS81-like [Mercenaria mercenaria]XP_053377312.1 crossover junction endonuclease MUS81-like [Mercenaria mercenaria]XP_053377319.1 crossover junction endonuclease MUS81-like [Mercenaria mercenaria]XP_053377323.1 crossover junction endonuclease MUS81-like [Mercenaria mercenaria]